MKPLIKVIFLFLFISAGIQACAQNHPFADEIKHYKEQDKTKMPPAHSILFVGSSSFRLWDSVQNYFPGFQIINRGFGGSSLKDVIYYADDIIFPYHARQIVIYCGENDLAEANIDASVVLERFKILFELIRKHDPQVPVAFVSMKPSPSRRQHFEAMIAGNAAIKYYLSKQSNTSYIDVFSLMLKPDGNPKPEIFKSDSLHMNGKGYRIWQQAITPVLKK